MTPGQPIPPIALIEKNLLATGGAFIWLYEIEVPTDPPVVYRLVRASDTVEMLGDTYYPFPITHSTSRQDIEGSLPELQVTVSNVSREIIATLEAHQGLVGQRLRIMLTHSDLLGPTGQFVLDEEYKIVATTATEEAVSVNLGDISLYETKIPSQRMLKHYCRFQYRGAECGYAVPTDDDDYLAACDKSLDGPNGCAVHGASELAAGMAAVLHPERFGGFPGIPTQTTGGAI